MSRRTRTKIRKNQDHYGLGTSHHNQYASSSSHFPKSYSALGKQIKFPSTAVAFLSQGKLTFYGDIQSFEQKNLELNERELQSIHTVNIGIKGKISQKMSQLNNCIFAFSMILCCVSQIFNTSSYRRRFYTKYQFDKNNYRRIVGILQKMPNLSSVMFTFQDNLITKQKLQYIDTAFFKLNLRSLTLRNLAYFIWPEDKFSVFEGKIQEFDKIKSGKTQFIFVWQSHTVKYNPKDFDQQKQSIAASLCDQI